MEMAYNLKNLGYAFILLSRGVFKNRYYPKKRDGHYSKPTEQYFPLVPLATCTK